MTGAVSSFTLMNLPPFFALLILLYITFTHVFVLFCGRRLYLAMWFCSHI